jgi:hypothetical protein
MRGAVSSLEEFHERPQNRGWSECQYTPDVHLQQVSVLVLGLVVGLQSDLLETRLLDTTKRGQK